MTKDDLIEAGIINNNRISDVELGLLLLKYNKLTLEKGVSKFERLEAKIKSDFNFGDRSFGFKERQKTFLKNCLAICQKPFQVAYIRADNNIDALFAFHKIAVADRENGSAEKENIRVARSIANTEDVLKQRTQKYVESKDQYDYLLSCMTDDDVFDVFYHQRLEGRVQKEQARQMLSLRFPETQQNFLAKQDNFFNLFTMCHVIEDSRMLSYSEKNVGLA